MEYVRFGELYDIPSSNGVSRPSAVRGKGFHMINMGELFSYNIINEIPMDRVLLSDKEQKKFFVNKGDLLFARQSLVASGAGKCSIVNDIEEKTTFESHLIRVRLSNKCNPWYYFYLFQLPYNPVKTIVNQCAQAGIRGTELIKIKVPFPQKLQQDKIASILSTYDTLIENNTKRIRLLEQMAENLYKEWFVRFRFPGHENVEMENGLPKGWKIEKIGNVCETIGGGTPSTSNEDYWGGDIKWVTPSDLTSKSSLPLLNIAGRITEEGLKKSSAKLLPPCTILMTSRASIGFFGICPESVCTNQGFISIIPNEENLRMFLLYSLKTRKEEIIANANGSTFLENSKGRFRKMKILIPSEVLLKEFEQKEQMLFKEVLKLEQQNQLLTRQRDLLLPRLMSGKLEVKP